MFPIMQQPGDARSDFLGAFLRMRRPFKLKNPPPPKFTVDRCKPVCHFLELPVELRVTVYLAVLQPGPNPRMSSKQHAKERMAIMRTCKQMHEEAEDEWYRFHEYSMQIRGTYHPPCWTRNAKSYAWVGYNYADPKLSEMSACALNNDLLAFAGSVGLPPYLSKIRRLEIEINAERIRSLSGRPTVRNAFQGVNWVLYLLANALLQCGAIRKLVVRLSGENLAAGTLYPLSLLEAKTGRGLDISVVKVFQPAHPPLLPRIQQFSTEDRLALLAWCPSSVVGEVADTLGYLPALEIRARALFYGCSSSKAVMEAWYGVKRSLGSMAMIVDETSERRLRQNCTALKQEVALAEEQNAFMQRMAARCL